jgi:SAM-dependent methyltransferase
MLRKVRAAIFLNSSRIYLERFLRAAAQSVPAGAHVLDAGAGDCRYKPLFAHTSYVATDFCQVDKPYHLQELDYIADLKSIPVWSGRYDLVVCSQVLEHINEPKQVLRELYRVLKPDGALWLSAPLFYEEHEVPHDYFRYTQFGLRHLLESVGFQVVRIEPLEGYFGTLAYQHLAAARALPITPPQYGGGLLGLLLTPLMIGLKGCFALLAIAFAYLDLYYKNTEVGYCKNYSVVARKPRPTQAAVGVSSIG